MEGCLKENIGTAGKTLNDKEKPLKDRFKAVSTLRDLGGNESIDELAAGFCDESAVLKHELAHCLGQMQNPYALPQLVKVLEDESQDVMVRHAAADALGTIGDKSALDVLEKYCIHHTPEIAETCQLAVGSLQCQTEKSSQATGLSDNPYMYVDQTLPVDNENVEELKAALLDESLDLIQRYRAMSTLRSLGTEPAALALTEGLKCSSALLRHKIADVLGQVQSPACLPQLSVALADPREAPMVRHECAEALGSIATPEAIATLEAFLQDSDRVVRESCMLALDMS